MQAPDGRAPAGRSRLAALRAQVAPGERGGDAPVGPPRLSGGVVLRHRGGEDAAREPPPAAPRRRAGAGVEPRRAVGEIPAEARRRVGEDLAAELPDPRREHRRRAEAREADVAGDELGGAVAVEVGDPLRGPAPDPDDLAVVAAGGPEAVDDRHARAVDPQQVDHHLGLAVVVGGRPGRPRPGPRPPAGASRPGRPGPAARPGLAPRTGRSPGATRRIRGGRRGGQSRTVTLRSDATSARTPGGAGDGGGGGVPSGRPIRRGSNVLSMPSPSAWAIDSHGTSLSFWLAPGFASSWLEDAEREARAEGEARHVDAVDRGHLVGERAVDDLELTAPRVVAAGVDMERVSALAGREQEAAVAAGVGHREPLVNSIGNSKAELCSKTSESPRQD